MCTSETIITISIVVVMILLIKCLFPKISNCLSCNEGFSLSKKPVMMDDNLLHRNPYDDIDYITPTFTMLNY